MSKAPIPLDQPGLPISSMPEDKDISGNEIIPSVEGAINYKMSLKDIKSYMVGETMSEREASMLVNDVFQTAPKNR